MSTAKFWVDHFYYYLELNDCGQHTIFYMLIDCVFHILNLPKWNHCEAVAKVWFEFEKGLLALFGCQLLVKKDAYFGRGNKLTKDIFQATRFKAIMLRNIRINGRRSLHAVDTAYPCVFNRLIFLFRFLIASISTSHLHPCQDLSQHAMSSGNHKWKSFVYNDL